MKKFLEEFKAFALRGNLMDMAVGVVVGGAFSAIANSLVADIVMPIISVLTGGVDFASLSIALGDGPDAAQIAYGMFIQNIVVFIITAFAVFLVIKAMNSLHKKQEEPTPEAPKGPTQEELLTAILAELKEQNAANAK